MVDVGVVETVVGRGIVYLVCTVHDATTTNCPTSRDKPKTSSSPISCNHASDVKMM